ncbi:nitrate reductase [Desulfovibrio sp. PG-178-WT-4]|uniref:Nitrate reductase n=1 Tax=Desulfovibrio porci TaxID=2605782 RepID=A0A6L5XL77_9BACT|nr:nitrate reductase [Desulfovibrio porci]MDY3810011.1 nitrate reductase [Desulfovibrio porci]MSS27916.1 nitrate reductase [Desulfovibrio porci]
MNASRREFLRCFAMSAAVAAASGTGFATLAQAADDNRPDKWVKGVCRYCGTGCGVMVGVKNGKAVAIQGDPNNHNAGLLCLKGSMLIPVLNSRERVTQPMLRRRKGGELEPVSWDEALDLMARKFRASIDAYGPDSVAWYGSGQCLTEETYVANKIFKGGFGTNNVDGNPRLCMASAVGGYLTSFGKDEPMGTYADIDHATCFFIIGSNTSEAHPVLFRRIARRKQMEPGVKIIVADPRRTNTSRIADLHIAFRPGTDLALMHSMAWVIINEELDNPRFWQRYVNFMGLDGKPSDFEGYKAFLEDFRPEKAAEICRIPVEQIYAAARAFAESPATMSLWCMGINQRVQGVAANNLIHNLHLLTGQICRPGATPFSLTGQPNACGGVRDGGALSHLLPAGRMVANPKHRAEMEKLWGLPEGRIAPKPGYHTVALFEALGKGDVKCMLICETNPAQTLPNLNKFHKAMSNPESFIVCIEAFPDAVTLQYADLVLAPAFWCERDGVYGCGERRYALTEKAVEPPAQCRPTVNTLVEFAKRAGVDPKLVNFRNAEDVWNEWRMVSKGTTYDFWGMTRDRLRKESGLIWPCPGEDHPGTSLRYVRGQDPNVPADHPDRFFFYGKPDGKAVIWMRPYKGAAEEPDAEYPLYLTSMRVIDHWHTATMTGKVPELQKANPAAYVEINAEDAAAAGIRQDDTVVVETRRASMELPARVSDVCRPGLIAVPFFDPKKLVNKFFLDATDPASREPEYKICAARIRKA